MRRAFLTMAAGALASLIATEAGAVVITESFSFLGQDADGTGSANLTVVIDTDNDFIEMTIDNTSPIVLDDSSGDPNAPGIVGFGANFQPDTFDVSNFLSWSLVAFAEDDPGNTNPIVIGNETATPDNWILFTNDTTNQGIQLDLNPDNGSGVQDALYNPLADPTAFGADPNFLTTGTFTIFYSDIPDTLRLAAEPSGSQGDLGDLATTVVRMQNVGTNGAGSLKLSGTPQPVPEPSVLALLGTSLLAIGFFAARRRCHDA